MSYGPSPQTAPPKGPLLGLTALVLGLLSVVVPFLPVNLDLVRPYVAFVFAFPALVVACFGLLGNRRGKPMAAIGVMLSLLGLLIGAIMIGNLVGVL